MEEKVIIRLIIERMENGNIRMKGTPADNIVLVGMLEWVKGLIMKEQPRVTLATPDQMPPTLVGKPS